MIKAFILVNVEANKHMKVLEDVKKIEGVHEAHLVTGLHDLILYVSANDLKSLGSLIVNKIQKIDGIQRTITCIALD
ncbi:MAG: Lrp/AsnC ligand binding domain-containing protein [Candidatus Hydrothermales bacterium]